MATQVSDTGSKKARGSLDELAVIAQRAQAFTNASGTAIALSEGSSDEIICRARSGASAPDVGTALRVEGSFTGLCIQSGKELRCDDAETDTRVDTAAIRALGIRSMVVTPIKEENRVVGVLAVFAPTAHAFTITHVAVLKTMADQISVLLQKERKAREEGVHPEPAAARPSAPVAMAKPVAAMPAAAAPAPAPTPTLPPPVVIKPAAPAARAAAFPVVSKVEPIKTAPISEDVAIAVPLPRREDRRGEAKAEHRASMGTLDTVAEEGKKPANRLIMFGLLAVVVIGAGATFAYMKLRKPTPPAAVVTPPQPATTAPAVAPGTPAATNGQPAATGTASTGSGAPAANNAAKTAPEPIPADSTRKVDDRSASKQQKPSAATSAPAPVSTPSAVAIATGESKINQPAGGQATDVSPVLNLGQGTTAGEISALTKPSASSTPSMISQSDLEPAQVLKKVSPVYPAIARARRLSGTVTVEFTVGKDGKISNVKMTSGLPIFRDAAFDAVKQWVIKPARLNGQPIEQTEQVKLNFNPS
jgi:TonB family protein